MLQNWQNKLYYTHTIYIKHVHTITHLTLIPIGIFYDKIKIFEFLFLKKQLILKQLPPLIVNH